MIDLSTPLSLASSFRFRLQSPESRREIAWGALLLVLLPGIGWFLNMGHRIVVVHRMQHGEPPWPAWKNYPQLLGHGLITFGGMLYYSAPGLALAYVSWALRSRAAAVAAAGLLVAATLAIPGYMSHYCREFDPAEIYNPLRALGSASRAGRPTGMPGSSPCVLSSRPSAASLPSARASSSPACGSGRSRGSPSPACSRDASGSIPTRRPTDACSGPDVRWIERGYSDPYNAARISAARVSPVVPGDILFMM